MKIYLAGPMRNLPGWNFAAFDRYAVEWTARGWIVFNPAAMARGLGIVPPADGDPTALAYSDHIPHVFANDVEAIFRADAIALLPGWENSAGATAETALGLVLGRTFYDAETAVEMKPHPRPWAVVGAHGFYSTGGPHFPRTDRKRDRMPFPSGPGKLGL